jgi:transcriptional antiterminator RfaH
MPKLLRPADVVTLTKALFTDSVASIESIAPDKRISVLMELMGVHTRVPVSGNHLRTI